MLINRSIKSILLIVGTSIGTGILALPLATASSGVFSASLTLFICCIFMTLGAFYVTEVTLRLKENADFKTMARVTLGRTGEWGVSLTYVLLLYALTAMYILVGGSWFLQLLKESQGLDLHSHIGTLIFAGCLMPVVFYGMRTVGRLNQYLTTALLLVFAYILAKGTTHIVPTNFTGGEFWRTLLAIPLMITSFGSSIVMPTLTAYLNKNVRALKVSLLVGSAITLGAYLLWEGVAFGVIGMQGPDGLIALADQPDNGTVIVLMLAKLTQDNWLATATRFFVIFAVMSSVLGVTLSLYHFIRDALNLPSTIPGRLKGIMATFLPPVALLLLYPMGLQHILSLAGLFVALLLGLFPALMALRARKQQPKAYKIWGGTLLIGLTILFFIYVVIQEILNLVHG